MKAKCPHCLEDNNPNCEKCNGTGKMSVSFAEGEAIYTRSCRNPECGFTNGGCISKTFPEYSSGPCVICDEITDWVLVEEAVENDGWIKNQDKFYIQRLEKTQKQLVEKISNIRAVARTLLNKHAIIDVETARLLDVCRICKQPSSAPFKLNYGEEYAHTKCLNGNDFSAML